MSGLERLLGQWPNERAYAARNPDHRDRPLALLPFGIDLNIFEAFTGAIEWIVQTFLSATLHALGVVLNVGIETYLFFENPVYRPALDSTWRTSFLIFLAIVGVGLMHHLVVMLLSPYSTESDLQRLLERITLATVVVFLSRPFVGLVVSLTHSLSGAYYNVPFRLTWGVDVLRRINTATDNLAMVPPGVGLFVSLVLTSFTVALLVVFAIGLLLFFVVRMFAVYVTYALFPLFMSFWIFDYGPVDYVRDFTNKGFQMTAYLLLYGPIATAFLWIGAELGDFTGGSSTTASSGTAMLVAAFSDLFMLLASIGAVMVFAVFGLLKTLL